MGILKIGSSSKKKGVAIDPNIVLFNGKNVKYIKNNSTEIWTCMKPLVPVMTSNTAPYGQVIKDSEHSSGMFKAYYVFDGKDTTRWHSTKAANAWIGYQFTVATKINKVMIQTFTDSKGAKLKNFIVQGSNNNSAYDDLYTGIMENSGEAQYFEFENEKYYSYYRVWGTDNYTSDDGSIGVVELQFYGTQS